MVSIDQEAYLVVADAIRRIKAEPSPRNALMLDRILQETNVPLSYHVVVPCPTQDKSLELLSFRDLRKYLPIPYGFLRIIGSPRLPSNDTLATENPIAAHIRFSEGKVSVLSYDRWVDHVRFHGDLIVPTRNIMGIERIKPNLSE